MLTPPKTSPWGTVQQYTELIPGVWSVSTPSHGGIKVTPQFNAKIPDYAKTSIYGAPHSGWYEEDVDWCIPYCFLEQDLNATRNIEVLAVLRERHYIRALKEYHPDIYEQWTGTVLAPGESRVKDEKTWQATHIHDLQAVGAEGPRTWNTCPEGFVLVSCCYGGRMYPVRSLRQFLIPKEKYQLPHIGTFIVDPEKYQEVTNEPT